MTINSPTSCGRARAPAGPSLEAEVVAFVTTTQASRLRWPLTHYAPGPSAGARNDGSARSRSTSRVPVIAEAAAGDPGLYSFHPGEAFLPPYYLRRSKSIDTLLPSSTEGHGDFSEALAALLGKEGHAGAIAQLRSPASKVVGLRLRWPAEQRSHGETLRLRQD